MDPRPIGRADVLRLVADQAAQLVEVLSREQYDDEHLPEAISVPLTALDAPEISRLDANRPVVVYCWDSL